MKMKAQLVGILLGLGSFNAFAYPAIEGIRGISCDYRDMTVRVFYDHRLIPGTMEQGPDMYYAEVFQDSHDTIALPPDYSNLPLGPHYFLGNVGVSYIINQAGWVTFFSKKDGFRFDVQLSDQQATQGRFALQTKDGILKRSNMRCTTFRF